MDNEVLYIRVPAGLKARIVAEAKASRRSLNEMACELLQVAIGAYEEDRRENQSSVTGGTDGSP